LLIQKNFWQSKEVEENTSLLSSDSKHPQSKRTNYTLAFIPNQFYRHFKQYLTEKNPRSKDRTIGKKVLHPFITIFFARY
jgi:hypothetical protein